VPHESHLRLFFCLHIDVVFGAIFVPECRSGFEGNWLVQLNSFLCRNLSGIALRDIYITLESSFPGGVRAICAVCIEL